MKYLNNDEIYGINIIFKSSEYVGTLNRSNESKQLEFIDKREIPSLKLNHSHSFFINDWLNGQSDLHVD